jgi:hypothetical protein
MAREVVHISNRPCEGVQDCSRCGHVLLDRYETNRKYFPVGVYVVVTQKGKVEEMTIQKGDAARPQIKCEALPVDLPPQKSRWNTA